MEIRESKGFRDICVRGGVWMVADYHSLLRHLFLFRVCEDHHLSVSPRAPNQRHFRLESGVKLGSNIFVL